MRIFIAGATGAIGLPLTRALCTLGHHVTGMTRAGTRIDRLRELGAAVSIVDAFDAGGVLHAIEAAAPDVVIDQLTSLPADPTEIISSLPGDTRLRKEGGASLLAAAKSTGVRRMISQSRGFFLDAPDGHLAGEMAPLRYDAPGMLAEAMRAVGDYDNAVLAAPSLEGVILRYGFFYGPGTWYRPDGAAAEMARKLQSPIIGTGNAVWSFVHVDDAVAATVAALSAEPGIYNSVDDDPLPVSKWLPAFARWVGAKEPPRVSLPEARNTGGEEAIFYHTALTGASNRRAKAQLGFAPRRLLWRPHREEVVRRPLPSALHRQSGGP